MTGAAAVMLAGRTFRARALIGLQNSIYEGAYANYFGSTSTSVGMR